MKMDTIMKIKDRLRSSERIAKRFAKQAYAKKKTNQVALRNCRIFEGQANGLEIALQILRDNEVFE